MINKLTIITVLLFAGTNAGIAKIDIVQLLAAQVVSEGLDPFQLCEEKTDLEIQLGSTFLKQTLNTIQNTEINPHFLDNRGEASSQVPASAEYVSLKFNNQARFKEFVDFYQARMNIQPFAVYRFPGVYHGKCYFATGCSDETESDCTVHITYFQENISISLDTFLNRYPNFEKNNRWKALISLSLAYAIGSAHNNRIVMKNFSLSNIGFRESKLATLNNKMLVAPVTVCFLDMNNAIPEDSTVNYIVNEGNYQAPEFKTTNQDLETPQFTTTTDVYTLGITIYSIFNFKQWTNRDKQGNGYQILPCPGADPFFCTHYKEFFKSVTQADPARRDTLESAINRLIRILKKIDPIDIKQFAFNEVKTGFSISMPSMPDFSNLMGKNEGPKYPVLEDLTKPFYTMMGTIYPTDSQILQDFGSSQVQFNLKLEGEDDRLLI